SAEALFRAIVSLSYVGDVRVGVAESPTKVHDIVAGARQRFEALYLPNPAAPRDDDDELAPFAAPSSAPRLVVPGSRPGPFRRAPASDAELRAGLPPAFAPCRDAGDCARVLAGIVRRPSLTQSLKGVLTGGPVTALSYLGAKLAKRFR